MIRDFLFWLNANRELVLTLCVFVIACVAVSVFVWAIYDIRRVRRNSANATEKAATDLNLWHRRHKRIVTAGHWIYNELTAEILNSPELLRRDMKINDYEFKQWCSPRDNTYVVCVTLPHVKFTPYIVLHVELHFRDSAEPVMVVNHDYSTARPLREQEIPLLIDTWKDRMHACRIPSELEGVVIDYGQDLKYIEHKPT